MEERKVFTIEMHGDYKDYDNPLDGCTFLEFITDMSRSSHGVILSNHNIKELNSRSDMVFDRKYLKTRNILIAYLPTIIHYHHFNKFTVSVKAYNLLDYNIQDFAYLYSVKERCIRGILKSDIIAIESKNW